MSSKKCGNEKCQEWPKEGELKEKINKTLNDLEKSLDYWDNIVYGYVLTSVDIDSKGSFVQTGTGPNFQGGYITLCTCKHFMRTWRTPEKWKGIWIAGFTSKNILGDNRNYLFYLMQVQHAFISYRDLWEWLAPTVREAKSASKHRCGDVYEPAPDFKGPYDPNSYKRPVENHDHIENNEWHKDINYVSKYGKRPSLLVGNPKYSFLWSKPKICFNGVSLRTKKFSDLRQFLKSLREE